jgi:hypothetical protein
MSLHISYEGGIYYDETEISYLVIIIGTLVLGSGCAWQKTP